MGYAAGYGMMSSVNQMFSGVLHLSNAEPLRVSIWNSFPHDLHS